MADTAPEPDYDPSDRPGPGQSRSGFRPPNLTELPERLLELLRKSPAAEIEHQLKALVSSTVSRLDLVTREEFDIQAEMVERLRERVEALERQLNVDRSPRGE